MSARRVPRRLFRSLADRRFRHWRLVRPEVAQRHRQRCNGAPLLVGDRSNGLQPSALSQLFPGPPLGRILCRGSARRSEGKNPPATVPAGRRTGTATFRLTAPRLCHISSRGSARLPCDATAVPSRALLARHRHLGHVEQHRHPPRSALRAHKPALKAREREVRASGPNERLHVQRGPVDARPDRLHPRLPKPHLAVSGRPLCTVLGSGLSIHAGVTCELPTIGCLLTWIDT